MPKHTFYKHDFHLEIIILEHSRLDWHFRGWYAAARLDQQIFPLCHHSHHTKEMALRCAKKLFTQAVRTALLGDHTITIGAYETPTQEGNHNAT